MDEKPTRLGSIGGIAGIIFMVACCALAPVIFSAVAAGAGAWITGAGLAGAIALATVLGAIVYTVIWLRRKALRQNPRKYGSDVNTQSH